MLQFEKFQDGVYLSSEDVGDPASARIGFMFRDPSRQDTQILLEETWSDNLGYYLFFPPAEGREWALFARRVREAFASGSNRQFGWFASDGSVTDSRSFISVSRSMGSTPTLESSVTFFLRNVSLQVLTNPVETPEITLGDDTFSISNSLGNSISLSIQPLQGSSRQVNASAALLLPMTGAAQGSVGTSFTLSPQDLEANEMGCFYFGPPSSPGLPLAALRYPLLRPSSSLSAQARLDILAATDPDRTYFALGSSSIPSFFTESVGRTLELTPRAKNGTLGGRLVFAPRPVKDLDDTRFYYLSLAGAFELSAGSGLGDAAPSRARLLCGTSGTEYLDVGLEAGALVFEPGSAAYNVAGQSQSGTSTSDFLSQENGRAVTSWIRLEVGQADPGAKYVSQPQQSPLYDSSSSGNIGSDNKVYLLAFRDQAAWTPASSSIGPAVPMVPYSGASSQAGAIEEFLAFEANAINPARRVVFSDASRVQASARATGAASVGDLSDKAMTPQGLLAGFDATGQWTTTQIAISGQNNILQFTNMADAIRSVFSQNQVFSVISRVGGEFDFAGSNQVLDIADWSFALSPDGTPSPEPNRQPPILLLKFYDGVSIQSLVSNRSLWSEELVFNGDSASIQAYIESVIEDARNRVFGGGSTPDTTSIYYPFWQIVTSPSFSGVLALNANIVLNDLPAAIRAVLGGMTREQDGVRVSNVDAFRAHHVGVEINDTDPSNAQIDLAKSSLFGLVDYERPTGNTAAKAGVDVAYFFEVEFLRALLVNSELREFSSKIDLTINQLFDVNVNLGDSNSSATTAGESNNTVSITGSYQAHSNNDDSSNTGEGIYSFVAEGDFEFDFTDANTGKSNNPYLKKASFTKFQFSASDEAKDSQRTDSTSETSVVNSRFSMWGSLEFNQLDVLDVLSFEKLTFADMGITMSFDLTVEEGKQPTTSVPVLAFAPGDLRFDLATSETRKGNTSLLDLLPFKLTSFLYSEKADTTLGDLGFFSLDLDIPGFAPPGTDTYKFALIFDLDLGTLGALVGSLEAFKFTALIGWQPPPNDGLLLGLQLPSADGKLEITIEGVLKISIDRFVLKYVTNDGSSNGPSRLLVVALLKTFVEVFGKRLPPAGTLDFALFAPLAGAENIGWIAAYNNEATQLTALRSQLSLPDRTGSSSVTLAQQTGEGGDSKVFDLKYLGLGQRVGPDPSSPPTNFADFLAFMTKDFYKAFEAGNYTEVYRPDGKWIAVAHFNVLELIEFGFVFYDVTPFYSLTLNVKELFNFEITYTKVSDDVGLFFIDFSLPESLRQFNVGAVGVTLPSIAVSIYTNGDWKLDIGFPKGDDWSRSFQLQAQAGPFPVLGSGGFYIAKLSSATSDTFEGTYDTIVAFGFAARLGLGKDVSYGPLKAGVSVTFFGIIEGAAAWNADSRTSGNVPVIFTQPQALALKGEFGIIGELYGSIDFKIISASVNVRLAGAIGIELFSEVTTSITLYVRASVKVSAKASINLGLFKITISFSFSASIRLEWVLAKGEGQSARALLLDTFALRTQRALHPAFPLAAGLASDLSLWFLPELTVVFSNPDVAGDATFVCSLGAEFLVPSGNEPISPSDYKAFETLTAQLTIWAVARALDQTGSSYEVTREQLELLDQNPALLVGGLTYATLVEHFANVFQFSIDGIGEPNAKGDQEPDRNATPVPMFPFLKLQTKGRLDGDGQPQELDYVFDSVNPVSEQYLDDTLPAYFAQSIVNRDAPDARNARLSKTSDTPLSQALFQEYYQGLVKGAVDQLVQYMQDASIDRENIDTLISRAVGAGNFVNLAGSMSNVYRGGVRLPNDGFEIPLGGTVGATVSVYAALWQQFPVGQLQPVQGATSAPTSAYTIALSNPDPGNPWVTSKASFWLTNIAADPYRSITPSDLTLLSAPEQLPFLQQGSRSYSFQNSAVWTIAGDASGNVQRSLRPFPPALVALSASVGTTVELEVSSRQTGGSFLPDGTPLSGSDFEWATQITIGIRQVPGGSDGGGQPVAHVYSVSGANQSDQVVLRNLIDALRIGESNAPSVSSIDLLYQSAAGASGLTSVVDPQHIFILRTNTTIDSLPPTASFSLRELVQVAAPDSVPVGATIGQVLPFLQILEQASVTNQTGYDLYYDGNPSIDGGDFPSALFAGSNVSTLTVLVRYAAETDNPRDVQPWHNAIIVDQVESDLLYYAQTTAAELEVLDVAVAAGSVGAKLERDNSGARMQVPDHPQLEGVRAAGRCDLTYEEAEGLLRDAGVSDGHDRRQLLAEAGSAIATLDTLYNRVSFQIQSTGTGASAFVEGNLSVPASPQQPDEGTPSTTDEYRLYAPLYKRAKANVGLPVGAFLDRYASLGTDYEVDYWLTDAFGNQVPSNLHIAGTNEYFDNLISVTEWLGVQAAYDFRAWPSPQVVGMNCQGPRGGDAQPESRRLTVYLCPNANTLVPANDDDVADALRGRIELYQSIVNQLGGPGVSFYVDTNLDAQQRQIPLDEEQSSALRAFVAAILAYLQNLVEDPSAPLDVDPIGLTVTVPTSSEPLPETFGVRVELGITRDPDYISDQLKKDGVVIYPRAQDVVAPVQARLDGVDLSTFASEFASAFPALTLAVSLDNAPGGQSTSPRREALTTLRADGIPSDGSGTRSDIAYLWAVQRAVIDIEIGASGTFGYLAPKPLDTNLNSGVVPLPQMAPLSLPARRTFVDVDLDRQASPVFSAIDNMLAPIAATGSYLLDPDSYELIARGREAIARKYSANEVEWLFEVGRASDLTAARDAFEQQMRQSLQSAYTIDTIVQTEVSWKDAVAESVRDRLSLFGQVQRASAVEGGKSSAPTTGDPSGLSTARIDVVPGSGAQNGLLTFTYSASRIRDIDVVDLDLVYMLTHVEYFLEDESATPPGQARPSLWLQLVDPFPTSAPPHIGPQDTKTSIPLIFREYPTPPTTIVQTGKGAGADVETGDDPFAAAAAWTFGYQYQAQLTVHDEAIEDVTYDTDLAVANSGSDQATNRTSQDESYTLFEALSRLTAALVQLQPQLSQLPSGSAQQAVEAFAVLVQQLADNTTWSDTTLARMNRSRLTQFTDTYTVTDLAVPGGSEGDRQITLCPGTSIWPGAKLFIEALDLSKNPPEPYPGQQSGTSGDCITDDYTASISDDWVAHQVAVDNLDVRVAENALSGLSIRRNARAIVGQVPFPIFIYSTPVVSFPQPTTPFIDNDVAIDVAGLPDSHEATLTGRIETLFLDLLTRGDQHERFTQLASAPRAETAKDDDARRIKVEIRYRFSQPAAVGGEVDNRLDSDFPVVLARSFDLPVEGQKEAIGKLAALLAQPIQTWVAENGLVFGSGSEPAGAMLVFDITLYARLSATNNPVLRLRNVQLQLRDVNSTSN